MLKYFRRLIDSDDPADVKRLLGLVCSAFFIIASFIIIFAKSKLPNQELADKVLLYNLLIVLTSIFGMSLEMVGNIILEATKAKAAASMFTPDNPTNPNVVNPVTPPPPGKDEDGGNLPGDQVFELKRKRTPPKPKKMTQEQEDLQEIKSSLIKSLKPKKNASRKI